MTRKRGAYPPPTPSTPRVTGHYEKISQRNRLIPQRGIKADGRRTWDKFTEEKGGYAEAVRFASFSGTKIGELIRDELLALYPDGKIPEEAAAALIPPSLRRNYDHVIRIATDAQRALNERARTKTDVVHPAFSKPKAQNLALYVSKQPDFRKHASLFPQLTENQSLVLVDKTVQMNAELHSRVGLSPKITRRTAGACCKWCAALAGTYRYLEEVPKDVWRRHRACRCVVEYGPGNGSRRREARTNERKGERQAQIEAAKKEAEQSALKAEFDKQRRIARGKGQPYDATEEWLHNAQGKTGKVDPSDTIVRNGVIYTVDGRHVIYDIKDSEERTAEALARDLGAHVVLLPRVVWPISVQCPDCLINGDAWDIKTPTGNGSQTIYNLIHKQREQALNFVIDTSGTKLELNEIIRQVTESVFRSDHTAWVKTVVIVDGGKVKKVYER